MLIYKYVVFSYLLFFWNLMHKFRRDWSTSAWEKFHSFYAFELMIQFLAEEDFLKYAFRYSYKFNSWGRNNVEYWIFLIVECL